jgi:dihydroorotase/N-acyl-D-amino-acid deacylase
MNPFSRVCRLILVPLFLSAFATTSRGQEYDLIFANGRIVDGTGNPWFHGDVAVRGDQIVKVGKLDGARARRRIDARGMIVAPGFIDMMGQSEWSVLIDPRAESKVFQGITTEVTGEGGSIAPINDYQLNEQKEFISHFKIKVDWRTLDEYFARLARTPPALNMATFVGAAQVRQYVLHDDIRDPTAAELEQMRALVDQAMKDGARGITTALIYPPGSYAKTPELIELAKVAARHGGVYATHMRSEGDTIMEALDETLRIGKEAGIPVEIFHLKTAGKQNWGRMGSVIRRIENARAQGQDVTADQYPYTASMTGLSACIPPWAAEGGLDKYLGRLKDPATREKLKREIRVPSKERENMYLGAGGGVGILVINVLDRGLAKYEGKRLSEVAGMMGRQDELDALFDLIVADKGNTTAVYFEMTEADVTQALTQPWLGFCCDAEAHCLTGPLSEGKTHPRAFGSFPRVLAHYVREKKLLTLEEAIRKMSSRSAARVHLVDRGQLQPGRFADIVVFDPEAIQDVATFEDPNRLSVGMRYVLVNGQLVIDAGKQTNARPGRGLRGPGYRAGSRSQRRWICLARGRCPKPSSRQRINSSVVCR